MYTGVKMYQSIDVAGDRLATQKRTQGRSEVIAGLEGVVIAETDISAVDGQKNALSYRGIDISAFAAHSTFEETVYFLWMGALPTQAQLDQFSADMVKERVMDENTRRVLTALPRHVPPMDALRIAVSALSCSDNDNGDRCAAANREKALRLTSQMPTIVANYYRHQNNLAPIPSDPNLGHAANFLYMLHGERPSLLAARAMDLAMLLMAEHGCNASTFAARVTASTLADMYAAITSAIGTLKGSLHGGANRRAMEMMLEIGTVEKVKPYIRAALAAKQRIMGFGHRVYRKGADPRSAYLRRMLYALCAELNNFHWYEMAITVAETVEAQKGLYPNVDFYAAPLLYLLNIPLELFTTVFAISRVPGWTTHVMDQYAHNRLLRPVCAYAGPKHRAYIPIEARLEEKL